MSHALTAQGENGNAIYRKLGVSLHSQAVARSRELRLLAR
jgi:ATP/maltotriose-dependent transcriptional regulator MalT